jgi:hypothetical protein
MTVVILTEILGIILGVILVVMLQVLVEKMVMEEMRVVLEAGVDSYQQATMEPMMLKVAINFLITAVGLKEVNQPTHQVNLMGDLEEGVRDPQVTAMAEAEAGTLEAVEVLGMAL